MGNIVISKVVRMNNFEYPTGITKGINCSHAIMEGIYWRMPTSSKGVLNGFNYRLADSFTGKPTLDSLKVLRVRDTSTNAVYYVAITDGAPDTVFTDICGLCCGESYAMPAVVIPDPVIEETGCADVNGVYTYFSVTRPIVAGEAYTLQASLNDILLTPAPPPEGFASLAALQAWVAANWAPSTVTITGNQVTLNTTTGTTGSIAVGVKGFFESNAPGALTTGQHYHLAATVNGIVLAPIDGAANADLTTIDDLANAAPAYAAYGVWSTVNGKIRLVSDSVTSAALVVTALA